MQTVILRFNLIPLLRTGLMIHSQELETRCEKQSIWCALQRTTKRSTSAEEAVKECGRTCWIDLKTQGTHLCSISVGMRELQRRITGDGTFVNAEQTRLLRAARRQLYTKHQAKYALGHGSLQTILF